MIKKNNKERVIEELKEEKLENVFNIIPNISDKVLDYNEKKFKVSKMISNLFEDKRAYESDITPELLILSGIQSRMKQQFSINEVPLALTSQEILKNIKTNLSYDPEQTLLKEANIRAMLGRYEQLDKTKIEFNNYFIQFYNAFNQDYLNKAKIEANIHILDCSILDVNLNNLKYEGSSITHKGGEKLRGYKIGLLRGVTNNGGVVEEIVMSTASDHDFKMSEDMIKESKYLKKGDYLLEDRGFIDLNMFRYLNRKGINLILPVKKNMEIYTEAVRAAKENNNWITHPNTKRKGQKITLISDLERAWLSNNDKNKKPSNLELDYKINACIIRFDKDKNKDILTDEEILSEDEKYAYACIITNDTTLSCNEIIRLYEMRPEIEEEFRQLKDFWGLNVYRSTKYNIISFVIMISLMGYNFYKVFIEDEEGKQYIGKSLIIEEKHGLYIVKNVRVAVVTQHYFAIFSEDELLDLYADLDKEKRVLIKKYLTS